MKLWVSPLRVHKGLSLPIRNQDHPYEMRFSQYYTGSSLAPPCDAGPDGQPRGGDGGPTRDLPLGTPWSQLSPLPPLTVTPNPFANVAGERVFGGTGATRPCDVAFLSTRTCSRHRIRGTAEFRRYPEGVTPSRGKDHSGKAM